MPKDARGNRRSPCTASSIAGAFMRSVAEVTWPRSSKLKILWLTVLFNPRSSALIMMRNTLDALPVAERKLHDLPERDIRLWPVEMNHVSSLGADRLAD